MSLVALSAKAADAPEVGEHASPSTATRRVLWRLPSGETKAYLFRGSLGDGVVRGTLYDGEVFVTVEGTVAPDGTISGILKSADGSIVGSFTQRASEGSANGGVAIAPGQESAPAPVDERLGGGTWWVTGDTDPLTP